MTKEKIAILFNGPKYCGKDTATNALVELFGGRCEVFRFTVPVKEEAHRQYGLSVPYDHYEDKSVKDTPLPEFGGISPRQAYIDVGNKLRDEFGQDIVAKMLCDKIAELSASVVITPDCGGDIEAEAIADYIGLDKVLVFRIDKAGHSFEGDCRDWVISNKLRKIDVYNIEDQVDDYTETVTHIASMFATVFGLEAEQTPAFRPEFAA